MSIELNSSTTAASSFLLSRCMVGMVEPWDDDNDDDDDDLCDCILFRSGVGLSFLSFGVDDATVSVLRVLMEMSMQCRQGGSNVL